MWCEERCTTAGRVVCKEGKEREGKGREKDGNWNRETDIIIQLIHGTKVFFIFFFFFQPFFFYYSSFFFYFFAVSWVNGLGYTWDMFFSGKGG